MWKWLEQYFTFTRSEKNGVIALVVLIVLAFIFPSVYLYFKPVRHIDNSKYQKELEAFALQQDSVEETDEMKLANTTAPDSAKQINKSASGSGGSILLDINSATSADFEKLNGIGPVLATRIVKFRTVLGGFVYREQLKEVYGLSEETYQSIKERLSVKKGGVQKININTDDYKDLSKHPYLRSSARAIASYHHKNGDFRSVKDLKQIEGITDSLYRKIEPYVTVE